MVLGVGAADDAGVDAGAAEDGDVGAPAVAGPAVPAVPTVEAALHPVSDKAPRETVMAIFLNK